MTKTARAIIWMSFSSSNLPFGPKAKLLLLKLIQIFAQAVLVMKKLEVKETKTTQYSTFKTDIIKVGLVF